MHPISKLKRRITWLFSLLTGTILLGACVLACFVSIRQLQDSFDKLFASHFATVSALLQNNATVNMVELYQYEKENDVTVAIYENGEMLIPVLPLAGQNREELIELAYVEANADAKETLFYINTANDGQWIVRQQTFTAAWGARVQILVLKSTQSLQQSIRITTLLFSGIFIVALLCLVVVSRFFSSLAASPMRQAYQQQLEFATAAGHDLRTPITIIKSSAQILERRPESIEKNIEVIVSEADRLTKLVDDLLLLSAGRAETLSVTSDEVNLDSTLIRLYDSMAPLAQQHGFTLEVELPSDILPKVYGDENRIIQVLSSFINNALEYSAPATYIEIAVEIGKKHVLVHIIDHGAGIPDIEKAKVFEQFYRRDDSRSDRQHYGLGLPIAKKLAELQGGAVGIIDTPGGGATFVLKLPKV